MSHNPRYKLCGRSEETVDHLVSCCPFLAQREYKQRHDKIAELVHWQLLKMVGFNVCSDWWQHSPENVHKNACCKILRDFILITEHHPPHNKLTFMLKEWREVFLIDIAIPGDSRILQKPVEDLSVPAFS